MTRVSPPQKRRPENLVVPSNHLPVPQQGLPASLPSIIISLGPAPLPPPHTRARWSQGKLNLGPDGMECQEPLTGSSHQVTKEGPNRRWSDVNLYDNDHFVSTNEAPSTTLTPLQHRAQNLTPGLGVSRESPQCADEGTEELRGEVADPRSPSFVDEAVSPRPHAGPGVRVGGARLSGRGGRREGRAPSRVPEPDS